MDEAVMRCVTDAEDDYERQGGLDDDDLHRLYAAHKLTPAQVAEVRTELASSGLVVDDREDPREPEPGRTPSIASDALSALLRRAARYPLLTAEQEVQLGRRISMGQKAAEELEGNGRRGSDVNALELQVEDGRKAHQELVLANVRLAVWVARRHQNHGLDLEDLVHEAILGVMHAATKFDHTRGYKFSTYAHAWVQQHVQRAIDNLGRAIRLPVYYAEIVRRVMKTRAALSSRLERSPTLDELADALDMDKGAVEAAVEHSQALISLSAPLGTSDKTVADYVTPSVASVEEEVHDRWVHSEVRRRLADYERTSSQRGRVPRPELLRLRFGLNAGDPEPMTLEQIGSHFGVTRERARQVETVALNDARALLDDLRTTEKPA